MVSQGAQIVIERVETVPKADGGVADEVIHLVNRGAPVLLRNWRLTNGGSQEFIFPLFVFARDSRVRVHTGDGDDSNTDLYWRLNESPWGAEGGVVVLYNDAGNEVARHEFTRQKPSAVAQATQPAQAPATSSTPALPAQTAQSPRPQPAVAQTAKQSPSSDQPASARRRKLAKLPWLRPQKRR